MKKYSLGLDYGTLSARAVLVEVKDGHEAASAVYEYPHGIMDRSLPNGHPIPPLWALQHPEDYLSAIEIIIPRVLEEAGVTAEQIIGIGVDFTACTVMPVKKDGTPLCFVEGYAENPHAYVKLWKHHAAQKYADRINETASRLKERFLELYGGKTSSEWLYAKLLQIFEEDRSLFEKTDYFVEAGDWLIWQLTGTPSRSTCFAGYKALWNDEDGDISVKFLESLSEGFGAAQSKSCSFPIISTGCRAGELNGEFAKRLGLMSGTPVAAAVIDAHACVPAAGVVSPNQMLIIMGTSACHMLLSESGKSVPGICGVVKDGILPGFYGYEAGQSCMGDHFSWYIKNCLPVSYAEMARERGIDLYSLLREKADKLCPGQSGLVALDWFNGNRSVLVNSQLSGLILGMTISTLPEEIYRALVEATAFGTRKIIETFESNGIKITEIYTSGGIPKKDSFIMQIFADILNRPVKVSSSQNGSALGAAIMGTLAAGKENGGYSDVYSAVVAMGSKVEKTYLPDPQNVSIYERLYQEYCILHDYFGKGGNDVMARLAEIKQ